MFNHFSLIIFLLISITFSISSVATTFYPIDYEDSRKEFRKVAKRLSMTHPDLIYNFFKVPSRIDSDLTTDYIYIPAKKMTEKLLIITSGVHGVETFTSSAIQQMFLNEILPTVDLNKMGLLMIHSLNPYGFKYKRRVTENNVDLNRNFILERGPFKDPNDKYQTFRDFLNPPEKLSIGFFSKISHIVKTLFYSIRYGRPAFRQAILQGQYSYEKGIYFGGKVNEPQVSLLKHLLLTTAGPYKEVFAIDLHTGYGKRGTCHFFGLGKNVKSNTDIIEKVFKGYKIDGGQEGNFYTTTGDFPRFVEQILKNKKTVVMTFEYGTLDSQTTLGAIESLRRSSVENQGVQFGYDSKDDQNKSIKDFLDMFNPPDPKWREKVLTDSRKIFPNVIKNFLAY
ncbi:MAG: DUF2817 domain-containing protein [Bacteriovoracaceae bacterium]|nr:DUF2817 domain-containing protein [Bacteriovoracaceae bacterium]